MKKLALACILTATSVAAVADQPSYDYVGARYIDSSLSDFDLNGFGLEGSVQFHENFFAFGSYSATSDDVRVLNTSVDIDYDEFHLGLGFRYGLTNNLDFVTTLDYTNIDVEVGSASNDDSGYDLQVGLRGMVTDNFELSANIEHIDVDDSETGFNLAARYYFNKAFSVDLGYRDIDSYDSWTLGARYNF